MQYIRLYCEKEKKGIHVLVVVWAKNKFLTISCRDPLAPIIYNTVRHLF